MDDLVDTAWDADMLDGMAKVMRHRLRNIASGLRGAIGIISNEPGLDPAIAEYFPLMVRECDSLSDMADRISALFIADASMHSARDADQVTRDAVAAAARRFPCAEIRVAGDAGSRRVSATMQSALRELLENACESIEHVIVGVAVDVAEGGGVAWTVSDSGPGIKDPDLRARAFRPFVTNRPRHMGIGLALAHKLAARAGGACVAVEDGVGRADAWTVRLSCPEWPAPDRVEGA